MILCCSIMPSTYVWLYGPSANAKRSLHGWVGVGCDFRRRPSAQKIFRSCEQHMSQYADNGAGKHARPLSELTCADTLLLRLCDSEGLNCKVSPTPPSSLKHTPSHTHRADLSVEHESLVPFSSLASGLKQLAYTRLRSGTAEGLTANNNHVFLLESKFLNWLQPTAFSLSAAVFNVLIIEAMLGRMESEQSITQAHDEVW